MALNTKALPLEIIDLQFTYESGPRVLNGINLCLQHNQKLAILGANGTGKSTLLLHINGMLKGSGKVLVYGKDVISSTANELKDIRAMVGMIFHNPDDQLFASTVYDNVAFKLREIGLSQSVVDKRVKDSLRIMGIEQLSNRMTDGLSSGEKRRVGLATILSVQTPIIVADEPSAHLDSSGRKQLMNILSDFSKSVLVATHDIELVKSVLPECAVIYKGRIIKRAKSKEILQDTNLLNKCDI